MIDYIERAFTAICPDCGFKAHLGILFVNPSSNFEFRGKNARYRLKSESELYNIALKTFIPDQKLSVIRAVYALTNLNLIEAKNLVDALPQIIKKEMDLTEAEMIKKSLEEFGGFVSLESLPWS